MKYDCPWMNNNEVMCGSEDLKTGWYCTYGHVICVCSSGAYYGSSDSGGTTHCITQTQDTFEQIGGRDAVFSPQVFGARAD